MRMLDSGTRSIESHSLQVGAKGEEGRAVPAMPQAGRSPVGQLWCLQALGCWARGRLVLHCCSGSRFAAVPRDLLPWLGCCGCAGDSANGDHFDRTGLAVSASAVLRRIGRRVQIWDSDVGRWQGPRGAQGRASANGHPEDVWV